MLVRPVLRGLIFLSFAFLTACSSGPAKPVEVQVKVNEFSFESSLTEFKVGIPYQFVVTNTGQVEHEIMIAPPTEAGMMDMGEIDKMALAMVSADELKAGVTKEFDYTFTQAYAAGQLEFACHVPGHYEAGMKLPITVK